MKLTTLKSLVVAAVAASIIFFGFASAAHAAALTSVSATSTGSIANSGTSTAPIAIQATTATNIASSGRIVINYPTGWSIPGSSGACSSRVTLTGLSASSCTMDSSKVELVIGAIPASTTFTVTLATGSVTAAVARDFGITTFDASNFPPVSVDTGTATLAGAAPSPSGSSTSSSSSSSSSTSGLAATGRDNTGTIVLVAGSLMAGLVVLASVQVLRRRKNV